MTNTRQLKSRNQRDGVYCGYSDKHLRLHKTKCLGSFLFKSLRVRWNFYWAIAYESTLCEKYYAERYKP